MLNSCEQRLKEVLNEAARRIAHWRISMEHSKTPGHASTSPDKSSPAKELHDKQKDQSKDHSQSGTQHAPSKHPAEKR